MKTAQRIKQLETALEDALRGQLQMRIEMVEQERKIKALVARNLELEEQLKGAKA